MNKTDIKRLALIKYYYNQGLKQLEQQEPLNGFSILIFHDSIELFLNLICETYDVKFPDNFMQYWEAIHNKTKPMELSYKASMEKLNKARVGFKHHGIIPSTTDIESFSVITKSFFEENFEKYFNIEFSKISLTYLIENKRSREYLEQSEEDYANGLFEDCQGNLTKAYACLTNDFESNIKLRSFNNPFEFGDDIKSPHQLSVKLEPELRRYFQSISNSITKIQEVLKLITLGLDYKQYVRFSKFMVNYGMTCDDAVITGKATIKSISENDFEFCRNFVVETALTLQEFDVKMYVNDYNR